MKTTKFTEEQIAFALRQSETGTKVAEIKTSGKVSTLVKRDDRQKAAQELYKNTLNKKSTYRFLDKCLN
jgi:hypothetical protein